MRARVKPCCSLLELPTSQSRSRADRTAQKSLARRTLATAADQSQRSFNATSARTLATVADRPLQQSQDATLVPPFARLLPAFETIRSRLNRPLSLAEKILYAHLDNPLEADIQRGETYLKLRPARVAMQDASAQMAMLQFATCGATSAAVPASVHCDHLISAFEGAEADLKRAMVSEKEVFDFLESACRKFGINFWPPGSGIIHQVVLERYAAPGLLMLGSDSHTPNAGGLGAIAIGVGGADIVDALSSTPWELKAPKLIGVELKGKLDGWTTPKDVIAYLAGRLTVRGGTGHIIEYRGQGAETLSATGMATICNMGAEVGATTSTFAYSDRMRDYLVATGRAHVAQECDRAQAKGFLSADAGAEYDQHITIDLSTLEPHLNGPHTPDLATPLSKFADFVKENGWQDRISAALIGSCTNSSYEDMGRVASIAKQAHAHGLKAPMPFMVTPGSELINATIERDGIRSTLESVGGQVLANACGPCIGQWDRSDCKGEDNSIVTSFNRNFRGRNDGNKGTRNFLTSPEIVIAKAFSGRLSFDPRTDSLIGADGNPFKLEPPVADELPSRGYSAGDASLAPTSASPDPSVQLAVSPTSSRLELLEPFTSHFPRSQVDDPSASLELGGQTLLRVRGQCTTDAISAAGPWLRFKGHLSNLSTNTLIGSVNDETGKINSAVDPADGSETTVPELAQRFKDRGQSWIVVADDNYGEGSAREHAALQPRFLGAKFIVARSFARIHETNAKKQGLLPLTFADKADYSKINAGDMVETVGLTQVLRGDPAARLRLRVKKTTGEVLEVPVNHTLSADQAEWILAGSALNLIANRQAASASRAQASA